MPLLQVKAYSTTQVYQCKISVQRNVYHCGMHSHVSPVAYGEAEYVKEIGQHDCYLLHQTGILQIGARAQIVGIKPNDTTIQSVTLHTSRLHGLLW